MGYVIDAIRDSTSQSVTGKIVGVDLLWLLTPGAALAGKVADQFLILGVDTDDGQPGLKEKLSHPLDVAELAVSVRMVRSSQALTVDDQTKVQLLQKASDGGSTDVVGLLTKQNHQIAQTASHPFL